MKSLKTISDSDLLRQIRLDAENERKHGLAVIHQLREVAHRRLDARLGYSSLHSFCMEELKYSSTSAWRRIKSMDALEELPELESQIVQGTLTLTNLSQVQNFCEQNEKTLKEKREILAQVSGLSKRDTERKLAKISPMPERPEKVRPLDQELTEIRITLGSETLAALDKIKDLIAHAHPGASYAEVIAYLAKLGLMKLDPATKVESKPQAVFKTEASQLQAGSTPVLVPHRSLGTPHSISITQTGSCSFPPGEKSSPQTRAAQPIPINVRQAVPAATRREVWRRDQGRCGYASPETGRICGATAFVQIDHITPRALGGSNDANNLRLRCQAHNILAAVEVLGSQRMAKYVRR